LKGIESIFILFFGFLIGKLIESKIERSLKERYEKGFVHLLASTLKFSIYVITVIIALQNIGINLLPAISSLGILTFIVTFAFKDVLNNIASGILMSIDSPFKIGDLVKINGKTGIIEEITIRSVRVRLETGGTIHIPMSNVVNAEVLNFEEAQVRLRLKGVKEEALKELEEVTKNIRANLYIENLNEDGSLDVILEVIGGKSFKELKSKTLEKLRGFCIKHKIKVEDV